MLYRVQVLSSLSVFRLVVLLLLKVEYDISVSYNYYKTVYFFQLCQCVRHIFWNSDVWCVSFFFFFLSFKKIYFYLEDNHFTMLCWFLPYNNVNQPYILCLLNSGWRGRWEGGSGWGRHVNSRPFHFNVWQNSLQIKKQQQQQQQKTVRKFYHCYFFCLIDAFIIM